MSRAECPLLGDVCSRSVQAHRRISTLQLVPRLPGTIAGARRRFGGGASLCLHPGVARAVPSSRNCGLGFCESWGGPTSPEPAQRPDSELIWIGSEIPTHHGARRGARLIIFSWCRQSSWRHPFSASGRSRVSRPFKGLIFALDNLARESNKGRHLTWRGLQDEPQGEFLIEVDDLNLLNLYVPFWSWETIEARFVQAVLELYQVERAALSLPGPVIGIGCFWESRRLLQTTFFRVGNDRCAAGRRASSWRRSSASRSGRTCSAAWA